MNTKDVLLLVAGVVAGHLLATYLRKNRENAQAMTSSTGAIVDQTKIDKCNKEVSDYMATARFAGGTDLEALKKAKFDACMSASVA